ncbi:hypothetical protein H6F42_03050 [Pseudanabaena sp. FACHB-1998]|uniref:PFE-CTERM domain-containing protein n=1 Tax=Pseudanabaena sp. FACHB-1998 TaxID=2692858 RepID=UPI00168120FE|nr:hypothetical protein [Pseudanabaena sp. FACHB-1998]MBD2175896.1 hypothetical protein [Pseudanabaena sp. FACHB-1998]
MKLLNKISTYSLVTAIGFAAAISANPENAYSFTFGNSTSIAGNNNGFTIIAQGFQINPADLGGKPRATLQSIKFLFSVASPTATGTLFIYDTLPGTVSGTGAGSLFGSTSVTSTTNDTAFAGGSGLGSLTFNFTSTTELSTGTQYFAVFNARRTGQTVIINNEAYGFGNAYTSTGTDLTIRAANPTDARFIASATAVPFEFEASGGVAVLGGLFLANKLRKRNQKVELDEQS